MEVFLAVSSQADNTKIWPPGKHWYAPINEYKGDLENLDFSDVVSDNNSQQIHINAWERFSD